MERIEFLRKKAFETYFCTDEFIYNFYSKYEYDGNPVTEERYADAYYYAMSNLLSENRGLALENFLVTLTVGIAIGGGIIAASLLRVAIQAISKKLKKNKA